MATKTVKKATKAAPKKAVAKKVVKAKVEKVVKAEKAAKPLRKDSGHATKTVSKKAPKVDEAAIPSPEKQEIIAQFAIASGDTGSPEVQVALLTKRIEKLVGHLRGNPQDNHSRRGLLGLVSKRRRLLNYLEKKDKKRFVLIKQKLELT